MKKSKKHNISTSLDITRLEEDKNSEKSIEKKNVKDGGKSSTPPQKIVTTKELR